jgi:hypothetical protein
LILLISIPYSSKNNLLYYFTQHLRGYTGIG